MSVKEELDMAIGAHGAWKQKLRTAIDAGECESTPEKVKKDNNCAFGKWLHERIDPSVKSSSYYKEAVVLHADFHKEAVSILGMALNGKKEEASNKLNIGSDFSKASANLTKKLNEWKKTL